MSQSALPANPRRQKSEDAMAALRTAALEIIAEDGIKGLTLAGVGARAGVSRGLPNYHFGTKSGLIRHVVEAMLDQRMERYRARPDLTGLAAIYKNLDQIVGYFRDHPLEQRGFEPVLVGSVAEALAAVRSHAPAFAVLDMRLEDGTGLKVVEAVRDARPDARIIMLTGYGNIATAVQAVKAGAVDYLSKPADADDVVRALLARGDSAAAPPENPMSADRVRWEHIQRIYELCNHNVSETARRLNMHRRTLQRILAKRAPR